MKFHVLITSHRISNIVFITNHFLSVLKLCGLTINLNIHPKTLTFSTRHQNNRSLSHDDFNLPTRPKHFLPMLCFPSCLFSPFLGMVDVSVQAMSSNLMAVERDGSHLLLCHVSWYVVVSKDKECNTIL